MSIPTITTSSPASVTVSIPLEYGIWIRETGWLKYPQDHLRVVSTRIEIATTAAQLYCGGKLNDTVLILPVDQTFDELEGIFLERERTIAAQKFSWRAWWKKLRGK